MEESKLKNIVSLFEFVVGGMRRLPKTWDNLDSLFKYYATNKNMVIKHNSYRVIINGNEFELKQTKKEDVVVEDGITIRRPKIILIAAVATNNGLGKDNTMPWRLPKDFKRFKELTENHYIIMGRKTFESLPGILPNRTHLVITRDEGYYNKNVSFGDDVMIFNSIESAINFVPDYTEKVYIIGGGEIYKQTIDIADELEITKVMTEIDADAFFPEINFSKWKIKENKPQYKDERHAFDFHFRTYVKDPNFNPNEFKFDYSLMRQLIINNYVKNIHNE